jgi:hypothetical protein
VCLLSDLSEVHLRGSLHQPLLVEHQEEPEETQDNYFFKIIKKLCSSNGFASSSKTWKPQKKNSTCCNGNP